jgi:hypothetical protein
VVTVTDGWLTTKPLRKKKRTKSSETLTGLSALSMARHNATTTCDEDEDEDED